MTNSQEESNKSYGGFLNTLEHLLSHYKLMLWYIAIVTTVVLILLLLGE